MEKIGKYEILERVGSGGFGTVYKGYDPFLKRTVAIKTCTSEEEEFRRRFYREAEIFGSLKHPNITTVHDFGIHEDIPFLVQELLSGEDLTAVIQRSDPLPVEIKVSYLVQISRALEHAHSLGVIHRDIKPGNIRLLEDGSVKVMDFGIAKLAHLETQLTRSGVMVGTASYLSPEQIGEEDLDHRCDIFSFGVVAFELLVYERPFSGSTISSLVYEILHKDPRPITEAWPECPGELAELVMSCLARKREDRPSSFREILARLLPLMGTEDSQSAILLPEQTLAYPPDQSNRVPTRRSARWGPAGPARSVAAGESQAITSLSFLPASRSLVIMSVIGLVLMSLGLVGFGAWKWGRQSVEEVGGIATGVETASMADIDSPAQAVGSSAMPVELSAEPVDDPTVSVAPPVEVTRPASPKAKQLKEGIPEEPSSISDPEPAPSRSIESARPAPDLVGIPQRTVRVVDEEPAPASVAIQEPVEEELPLPSVEDHTNAVLDVLNRYEEAYENLDSEALKLAWPSLDVQQLRALERSFSNYQWLEMDIENCNVRVDGSQGTATCQVRRVIKPRAGSRQTDQRQTTFYLRFDNHSWVIDRL